ncbi:hypothetical protein [Runella sp.]|jgi:hypothetical protein|uniref:hypothetical protein n=1 Tax=Runella sp. TaxID=1960881 RepID=UPI0026054572|nr:hypothetical protein [Runella sp.]
MKPFAEVLEDAKELNLSEKEELIQILDKIIAEERREEIYQNYQNSLQNSEKRQFSSDITILRQRLNL